jgi:hypothetical protein
MKRSERQDLLDNLAADLLIDYKEAVGKKDWELAKTIINLYNLTDRGW